MYPGASRPNHGVFVEERMTRYAKRYQVDLRVVAPVPWFPIRRGFGEYSRLASTPRAETRKGIPILHPRVLLIPKIGMRLAPAGWYAACRSIVEKLHIEKKITILDAHYLYPDCIAAVRIARELQIPIVVSARGTDGHLIGNMSGPGKQIREACNAASAVVAVSEALGEHLIQIGVDRDKINIVKNGCDVDAFAPREGNAIKPPSAGRVILGIGRLVKAKGWHLAVDVMANIKDTFPDVILKIAGRGVERDALETQVRARGLDGRVQFLGEVDHDKIPPLLWNADRLLLPSFREGHPNVVVEAVAAGVPVIATKAGGIPEIIDDRFGDLSERIDVPSLTAAVERSLRREFNKKDFDEHRPTLRWDFTLDRLHRVFEKALAAGPPKL